MGMLSNTVSLCQFRIQGSLPEDDLFAWAGERLAQNGFRSIDHTAEELSVGWVQIDDYQKGDFEDEGAFRRDHYIAFTLRRDQRRLPAALLKAYMVMAENEFLATNPGMQRVPKQKKEELREAVRGSLFAKTLPAPSTYDAVWDTRTGLVTFASFSPKVVELFENLFKLTFEGLRLVTVHPFERARMVLEEGLKPALQKANRASTDAVLSLIQENRWLGYDFLLWLLYQTMEEPSEYAVNQPGPALQDESFVAYLNDRLVLLGGGESGVQKITVAGSQDNFSEVHAALCHGKQIAEATIYMEKRENVWKLTLKGEYFHFGSYRSPGVKLERDEITDEASEKEALFYERMYLVEEGMQLFHSLYHTFLRCRLGEGWPAMEKAIREWLEE